MLNHSLTVAMSATVAALVVTLVSPVLHLLCASVALLPVVTR